MTNPANSSPSALDIPADTKTPFQATAQVVGNASRITVGGGEDYTDRNLAFASHSSTPVESPSDIISTARSLMGRPLSGADIRPDTIVNVHGIETSVKAAVASGFLRQNAQGFYEEVGKPATAQATQGTPKTDQEALEEALKAEREQAERNKAPEATAVPDLPKEFHGYAEEFNQKADMMTHESVVQGLINTGEVSQHDLQAVATQLGIEPEEVQRRVTATHQAFVDQATKLAGPGADTAFEWARGNAPYLLKTAIRQHVQESNGSGYTKVMQAYMEAMPQHSPHLIMNSPDAKARDIRREPDGKITLAYPGLGRVEWVVAVRQGLIGPKLSR